MPKSIAVYLPQGFADWEGAFLFPKLRQANCEVIFVSEDGAPVESIGGMKAFVDYNLSFIQNKKIDAFVLIGSETWGDPSKNIPALNFAKELLAKNILIAAICGATVAVVRHEIVGSKKHTSNDLGFLKHMVPSYAGEANYQEKLAVRDQNLITASGVGPLEFTREILTALDLFTKEQLYHWYELYKNGVIPPAEFWD